jgi:hypothetical protein
MGMNDIGSETPDDFYKSDQAGEVTKRCDLPCHGNYLVGCPLLFQRSNLGPVVTYGQHVKSLFTEK